MKVSEKKRPNQRTEEAKSKGPRIKKAKNKAKSSQSKGNKAKPAKKDSKEDPKATTAQQPTHYEPGGSMPPRSRGVDVQPPA